MTSTYNALMNNLEELGLPSFRDNLDGYLNMIADGQKTTLDALYELSQKEMNFRKEQVVTGCVKVAHFPFLKEINEFDFGFQPSLDKAKIMDVDSANLFFNLIAKRYENTSTIITTNSPFSKWPDIFQEPVLTNALLDRLLHHCHVININGPSYRVKDQLQYMSEEA